MSCADQTHVKYDTKLEACAKKKNLKAADTCENAAAEFLETGLKKCCQTEAKTVSKNTIKECNTLATSKLKNACKKEAKATLAQALEMCEPQPPTC
jgi:hypothetical protein